ncbi:MAG: hypothetical protein MJE68_27285, partial [Proteobacteria bacterium]|nr:hypothetical protein [Pseudomonadota bacterium]
NFNSKASIKILSCQMFQPILRAHIKIISPSASNPSIQTFTAKKFSSAPNPSKHLLQRNFLS